MAPCPRSTVNWPSPAQRAASAADRRRNSPCRLALAAKRLAVLPPLLRATGGCAGRRGAPDRVLQGCRAASPTTHAAALMAAGGAIEGCKGNCGGRGGGLDLGRALTCLAGGHSVPRRSFASAPHVQPVDWPIVTCYPRASGRPHLWRRLAGSGTNTLLDARRAAGQCPAAPHKRQQRRRRAACGTEGPGSAAAVAAAPHHPGGSSGSRLAPRR